MDNVLGENAREISMDKVLRWDCRAAIQRTVEGNVEGNRREVVWGRRGHERDGRGEMEGMERA